VLVWRSATRETLDFYCGWEEEEVEEKFLIWCNRHGLPNGSDFPSRARVNHKELPNSLAFEEIAGAFITCKTERLFHLLSTWNLEIFHWFLRLLWINELQKRDDLMTSSFQ
jgi:hypothetical protein